MPSDAPPTYETATGIKPSHATRNGISPEQRRSMEDEHRPLPDGWVRQYDSQSNHQFFVDTRADPPRSIWHHPYDDETFLNSLPPKERDSINRVGKSISLHDIAAESSDDEGHAGPSSSTAPATARKSTSAVHASSSSSTTTTATPSSSAAAAAAQPTGLHKFGRRLKDKVTSTTHEQREAERAKRAELERQAWEAHRQARLAMQRAAETGQPQLLGKDRNGKDVYIEPPYGARAPAGAYGYNPYSQGPYAYSNARYGRPQYAYSRPYGYGYGGGLGLPLAGGILGGALLGAALF